MKKKSFFSIQSINDFPVWKQLGGKRILSSFELELTARCNLNCRHCYINLPVDDQEAENSELNIARISEIAEEAVSLGAMWCLLTGGEPLLRQDFFNIFLALKKKGLLVSVFTNATLITNRHIDFFKKYPPRDIEITVYGVTQETYETISRRPGSFKLFQRGLSGLEDAGIPVTLKAMAMHSNLREMPEISRFCQEHSYRRFRFDPFLHMRYDKNEERNREIMAERLTPDEIIALERSNPSRIEALRKVKIFPPDTDSSAPVSCRLFGCGIGKENFTITANGMFTFCSSLRDLRFMVDLKTGNLADAWEGIFPQVRETTSSREEYLKNCAACPIINLCRWCPAVAHLESGALDWPVYYFCRVAHKRAESMGIDKNINLK